MKTIYCKDVADEGNMVKKTMTRQEMLMVQCQETYSKGIYSIKFIPPYSTAKETFQGQKDNK